MEDGKVVHIRRCHLCGSVNERIDSAVERCDHCGKMMAPYYFFDEKSVRVYSDLEPQSESGSSRSIDSPDDGRRSPIRGLSVLW